MKCSVKKPRMRNGEHASSRWLNALTADELLVVDNRSEVSIRCKHSDVRVETTQHLVTFNVDYYPADESYKASNFAIRSRHLSRCLPHRHVSLPPYAPELGCGRKTTKRPLGKTTLCLPFPLPLREATSKAHRRRARQPT